MAVALALACAVLAALSYGVGSVMQAAAVRHTENRPNLDPVLLVRLVGRLPYVAGLALDLVGFVASVIALRTLPLFLVQSAIAGSVGVTAIAASIAFGIRLLGYERIALVALIFGFALLAISARPEPAASLGSVGQWILVCGVFVVLAAGALSARLDNRKAGIGLALCAGLSWTGTGISARVLQIPSPTWHVLIDPVALCLATYGLLGVLLFATALQRGSVTAAAAIVFTVETVVPSLIGVTFLGDRARSGFLIVAILGFTATVGGSIALARRSEPLPREAVPAS
jgi:drug/metabolite transporter (DMT)-like permease